MPFIKSTQRIDYQINGKYFFILLLNRQLVQTDLDCAVGIKKQKIHNVLYKKGKEKNSIAK